MNYTLTEACPLHHPDVNNQCDKMTREVGRTHVCTRVKGHEGGHIAHGRHSERLHVWGGNVPPLPPLQAETPAPDGGPAFPVQVNRKGESEPGMSLRDWFAGQALQGMLASPLLTLDIPKHVSLHSVVPENAYMYADAMLKAGGHTR